LSGAPWDSVWGAPLGWVSGRALDVASGWTLGWPSHSTATMLSERPSIQYNRGNPIRRCSGSRTRRSHCCPGLHSERTGWRYWCFPERTYSPADVPAERQYTRLWACPPRIPCSIHQTTAAQRTSNRLYLRALSCRVTHTCPSPQFGKRQMSGSGSGSAALSGLVLGSPSA
jgi:hypothetical protein